MCTLCKATFVLVIIGALNWGLVGLGGFANQDLNIVHMLLGAWPMIEWVVYVLVGLSGVYQIFGDTCSCRK